MKRSIPFFNRMFQVKRIRNKSLMTITQRSEDGMPGAAGATGAQGPQGVQGVKGDAGTAGSQGAKGDTGSQGIQGFVGVSGSDATSKACEGIHFRSAAFSIYKTATVSSGTAVFHLTADGLSTGSALFPTAVIVDSVNVTISDSGISYQLAWVFSNGNKTITVTANKITTVSLITGILGQNSAANGIVVKLSVWGY